MTAAAFTACYAEWKVIKTRATVQLVFELPIERADEAYQALGGMPIAAHEVWCGIARLDPSKDKPLPPHSAEAAPRPANDPQPMPVGEKQKRPFADLAPAQQAGILCNEVAFWTFLQQEHSRVWRRCARDDRGADDAAACVRELCEVDSRASIEPGNHRWASLVLAYRIWQRHPELSPA